MAVLVRLGVVGLVATTITTSILESISIRESLHGKKKTYNLSQWDNDISEVEKQSLIASRRPLINVIEDSVKGKSLYIDAAASGLFVDNLLYDDPSLRCLNKQEFFNSYEHNLNSVKDVKLIKCNPIHSQHCIHFAYDKEVTYNLNQTVPRSGTLVVTLTKEFDNEKIISIINEWNDIAPITPESRKSTGNLYILYRRMNLYFALFSFNIEKGARSWHCRLKEYNDS